MGMTRTLVDVEKDASDAGRGMLAVLLPCHLLPMFHTSNDDVQPLRATPLHPLSCDVMSPDDDSPSHSHSHSHSLLMSAGVCHMSVVVAEYLRLALPSAGITLDQLHRGEDSTCVMSTCCM